MRVAKVKLFGAILCCLAGGFSQSNAAPQQQQLRSIQLGGGGGQRGVAPGNQIPNFSQQLTFGPQLQFQNPSAVPQQLQQQQRQQPIYRPQQPQALPQQLQPTYIQHQRQGPGNTFPATPTNALGRPLGPGQPQPLGIKSPQISAVQASGDDDEYEDEEYEDSPPAPVAQQQFRGPPLPQIRPLQLQEAPTTPRPSPQRSPIRIAQPQHPEALSQGGPSRFQVAQPQQQQIRRPVQAPVQQSPLQQLQLQQQPIRLGQDSRLAGDRQTSTPAPVKTLDRYMRTNEDGSTSWGYTNEDGSFKEETLGVDCVVRGKYGYVDPDGVKREYEYQSGNPCDPNKRGQVDDEEEAEPEQQQQRLGGLLAARPVQYQPQQQQQFRQRPQAPQ